MPELVPGATGIMLWAARELRALAPQSVALSTASNVQSQAERRRGGAPSQTETGRGSSSRMKLIFLSDASFARLSIKTSRGGGFVVRERSSRESRGSFVGSSSRRASLRVAPHLLLFSRRWHALHTGFPACSPVLAVLQ